MRVKIKNFTSLDIFVKDEKEVEALSWPDEPYQIFEQIIPSNSKCMFAKIHDEGTMEKGCNALLRFGLSFSRDATECLYLKVRFRGGHINNYIFHSFSSKPHDCISPQQDWHSGYAPVCFWTISD